MNFDITATTSSISATSANNTFSLSLSEEKYNEYFNYCTKRLSVTLILLSDIAFSNDKVNIDIINEYLLIGKYSEIKATIIRDYIKRMSNPENNSYVLFKNLSMNKEKSEDFIKEGYLNQKKADINRFLKRKNASQVINKIDKFIEKYYNLNSGNLEVKNLKLNKRMNKTKF